MGMFDEISDTLFCPFCGTKQDPFDFQTKDLSDSLTSWSIDEILVVYEGKRKMVNIYTECKNKKCKKWIDIMLDVGRMNA